ncbi:MAG: TonB-dependent receptor plug domain-containing protein [Rikenellaceae bacterium]|nr:TonB-dependent receptor plug domain-containing protein [Rikenellaceae bacterium]
MRRYLLTLLLCLPLMLAAQQPDSLKLTIPEVTVKARKPLMLYRPTGNVAVDIEQLKLTPMLAGEKDIFKFLQLLPGVSAGKDGMAGLLVRGGAGDQTQILYDDVPIYNYAHAFGLLSIFSGEAVQSAEVAKGYISPAYGSRLSGLTQIRTRDGDREHHRQSLTVGTMSLAGTVDGPIVRNKGSYLLSARYFFPEAGLAMLRLPTRYGFYDVSGKLSYDLHPDHTVTAGVYSGDDHVYNFDEGASNGFGWGNTAGSLRLESRWSDKLTSTAVLFYSYLNNRQKSKFKDDDTQINDKTNFKTHEWGARLNLDQVITESYSLSYGASFSAQRFFPLTTRSVTDGTVNERSYPTQKLMSTAIYLNNRLNIGSWRADIGVRGAVYDNGRHTAMSLEPRAQLSRYFGQDNALWFSATMNSQPLVLFNRYYYSMPIDFWAPFRDNKLQRAWQLSIGGRTRLHEHLMLSIESYYKQMRNLPLIYDSDDFLLERGGFVYGTGRAFGVETMLQWQTERLTLTASYTYTNSRRRSDGVTYPFEYDIPHDFNIFAGYDVLKRSDRRHTLSLNVAWRTGLPYRLTNEAYPDTDGKPVIGISTWPTMRMRNYFRTDIGYCMERQKRNGVRTWQLSVVNVTNHKNPVSIYPHKGAYKAMVMIPIMPSVSYTRTFGGR